MKKRICIFSVIAIISFVMLITLMILVMSNDKKPLDIDINVANFFYDFRGDKDSFLYWFNRIITEAGFLYIIIGLVIVIIILNKLGIESLTIGMSVGLAALLNVIVKNIIERPRPDQSLMWMVETSSSFPSGHSVSATAFYFSIACILFMFFDKKLYKALVVILLSLLVFIVLISRLILGVHFFTDVCAGFFEGMLVASILQITHAIMETRGYKSVKSLFIRKDKNHEC